MLNDLAEAMKALDGKKTSPYPGVSKAKQEPQDHIEQAVQA